MPNEKIVAKQAFPSLENQKQVEFFLTEKVGKTAGGTLGQEVITPLVMEGNVTTAFQNPHISHHEEHPELHASSIGLAESIGVSLSAVHSQASASHSSWIDTKRGVSGEEPSSHATFAGLIPYRFSCHTIHSAQTSQFLGMKSCQVATQEQVSDDTETVYTGSVGHQRCSTLGGMPNIRTRSHENSHSARYNQLSDHNSWVNNTLEAFRQNLGGLRIIEPGTDTQSDEPLRLTNYFNSMNCMHQEMESGSDGAVTAKIVPVGDQTSGSQFTTQDLQGIYENYGNSSSHNIGKVQRDPRFKHSVEPYQKLSKKARELLKKKQIQDQLDFVDNFHGLCPKLVYIPTFSSIQEDENLTPQSPTWPGK